MHKLFLALCGIALFIQAGLAVDAKASEKKGTAQGEASVHFVELNPLILPVITDHGVTQVLSLVVSVEVDSEEKAERVRYYSPRLTDAFLSDLYGTFSRHASDNGGQIPIGFIKKRLNQLSGQVLGSDVVNDVLLQVMQSRAT